MSVLNAIDKVLSFLEQAKSDKKKQIDRQAPQAKKVQEKTQQIISQDIERRKQEIRLARQQIKSKSNPFKDL